MELLVLALESDPGIDLGLVFSVPGSWVDFEELLVIEIAKVIRLDIGRVQLGTYNNPR